MTAAFAKKMGRRKETQEFCSEELLYAVGTPSQSVSHVDGISTGTLRRPSTRPSPALRDNSSDENKQMIRKIYKLFVDKWARMITF